MAEPAELRPVNEICYLSLKTVGPGLDGLNYSILLPCRHGYTTSDLVLQMARDRVKAGRYVCGICEEAPAKLQVFNVPSSASSSPHRVIHCRYCSLDVDIVVPQSGGGGVVPDDTEVIRRTLSIPKGKMKVLANAKRVVILGTHEKIYEFDERKEMVTAARTQVANARGFLSTAFRFLLDFVRVIPSFFISMFRPPKRD
jgi:hypothetical protein